MKECEGGSEVSACRNDWTSLVRVARSYIITQAVTSYLQSKMVRKQAVKEVDAVRLRGEAVKRRRTHRVSSALSWPMEFGMGPVSVLLYKILRMCARRKR